MLRQLCFALVLLACGTVIGETDAFAGPSEATQLAQAQSDTAQPAAPASPAPDAAAPAADAPEEPIGNVATVTGSASVIRNDKTTPLKVKDEIYLNDVVQTAANSTLGITFIDATTFNLKASTRITIDNYVYEDGGKSNAGDLRRRQGHRGVRRRRRCKDRRHEDHDAHRDARHSRHHRPRRGAGGRRRQQSEQRRGQTLSRRRRPRRPHRGQRPRRRAARLSDARARAALPFARARAARASPRCRWRSRRLRCCATRVLCASFTRRRMSAGRSCSSSANSAAPIRPSSIRTGRSGNCSPARAGRMACPASGARTVCRDNPVSRRCRTCRIVADSSSPTSSIAPDSNRPVS